MIIVYLFFLVVWGIISMLFNFFYKNDWVKGIREKYSILYILFPEWRVFSPNPFNSDLKLFYRDLLKDGSTTGMKEVIFYSPSSKSYFNTYNRERKFFYSLYKLLSAHSDKRSVVNSSLYQSLKEYVSKIETANDIKSRQICIVRTFGYYSDLEKEIELIDYINYA